MLFLIRDFTYTPAQNKVIDKYGENELEETIEDAMIDFYISIHDKFLAGHNDQSMMDDDELFVKTALEYIYQNDDELQEE